MNYIKSFLVLILPLLVACESTPGDTDQNTDQRGELAPGKWRFVLDLGDVELPFESEFKLTGAGVFKVDVKNAGEIIHADSGRVVGDSIFFRMPTFDTEFKGVLESPYLITGYWYNHTKGNYKIPFVAEHGKSYRFTPTQDTSSIPMRYKVEFAPDTDEPYDAILQLKNKEGHLSGTFMTETGDYRFLEGNIIQNQLYLSTFDGSHAFYFSAHIGDSTLYDGLFKSGIHYTTTWHAKADTSYTLRDPNKLTGLKPGMDTIDFRLPNAAGDTVSWADMDLQNKVVIVDITGSWCPNCMDANRALTKITKSYDAKQVQVLPIQFETTDSLYSALPAIERMHASTGKQGPFLFGGKASRKNVLAALPMLDGFMSYPTLIFVGKDRRVARIYTGFYGPGTGRPYKDFIADSKQLVDSLVKAPDAMPSTE